eukprot:IDg5451t1
MTRLMTALAGALLVGAAFGAMLPEFVSRQYCTLYTCPFPKIVDRAL